MVKLHPRRATGKCGPRYRRIGKENADEEHTSRPYIAETLTGRGAMIPALGEEDVVSDAGP